jgi:hypothetical protein
MAARRRRKRRRRGDCGGRLANERERHKREYKRTHKWSAPKWGSGLIKKT